MTDDHTEMTERLIDAGIPSRRAELVAAVLTSDAPYHEIAERFDVRKEAIGTQVHFYRQQRKDDKTIRDVTPPVERRTGSWPES